MSEEAMNKQPSSNYCFICGRDNPRGLQMEFYDNGVDEVVSDVVVPEEYQSYPGVVHGGIVSSMLDEGVGRVALIGDHHRFMVSMKLEVKFRRPVPTDTPLRVVGRVLRLRGRRGEAVGEIRLPDGSVAAEASVLLIDLPAEIRRHADEALLGWRVDPDPLGGTANHDLPDDELEPAR